MRIHIIRKLTCAALAAAMLFSAMPFAEEPTVMAADADLLTQQLEMPIVSITYFLYKYFLFRV